MNPSPGTGRQEGLEGGEEEVRQHFPLAGRACVPPQQDQEKRRTFPECSVLDNLISAFGNLFVSCARHGLPKWSY